MKLEEAIVWAKDPILSSVKWLPRSKQALQSLISHAEATRWRKLEEEKPTEEEKWFEIWETGYPPEMSAVTALWHFRPGLGKWGFIGKPSHWRPIVGPEVEG